MRFLFCLFFSLTAISFGKVRPNVLFIVSDDLNTLIGAYGDPLAKTPNLDRLAARGVLFEKAYCQYPLCGPSRNSFLTGLYPNSTGIYGNSQIFRQTIPKQPSMPQAFRHAGYFSARLGKMYHYDVPNSIGTDGHDDPASWELELNPAGCDRTIEEPDTFTLKEGQFGGVLSWYASPRPDAMHTDGMLARDAEWVMERCAKEKDRPFFLALGFFRPHTPFTAPEKYFAQHPREEMPLITGVEEDQKDIPKMALASQKPEEKKFTDDLRRECRQAYSASISFMDAQLGATLDALDRLGLTENTIVVFTSDHGYHMGEHGLWKKQSLFEESARVPLIIAGPGVANPGTVADSPVAMIDIFPTLAELCGVTPPGNLQGQSLVPMLKDPSAIGRGWALSQVLRGGENSGYSLRTPRWRYTEWNGGKAGRELYDHENDPGELTNLAEDPASKETLSDLSEKLAAAVKTTFPKSGKPPVMRKGIWSPRLGGEAR